MLRASRVFERAERCGTNGGSGQPRNRDMDYTVELDPSGDYRRGATFARVELKYMMAEGSVETGTVLCHRNGTRWRVAGRELVEA